MPPRGTADAPIKDFNDLINGKGPFARDEGLRIIKDIFEKALAGKPEKTDKIQSFSLTKKGLTAASTTMDGNSSARALRCSDAPVPPRLTAG
jgi:hypothetical protein